MRIRVSGEDLAKLKADLAVCFAYEKDKAPRGVRDVRLRRELARQMKSEEFKGRTGDKLVWNGDSRYPARRFLVLGLGPEGGAPGEAIRVGCARAARAAAAFSARSLAIRLPPAGRVAETAELEIRGAAEGAWLGAYQFDRYLTDPVRRQTRLHKVELAAEGPAARIRRAVGTGEVGGRAVCLARDLVNEAPSRLTPREMARRAAREARAAGVTCRVAGPLQLRKRGLTALLAVARGSKEPAQVVHMTYKPRGARTKSSRKKTKKILLIGKGVTFDSGGLNLKPGDSMLTMKMDMAGAAAVLATMTALGSIGCSVEVHALLGLVENMTGGAAYKPGDILDTHSGKTVEVGNTDAEGRLVLCDLLSYGVTALEPTHVVDVATLTGACVVALGTRATGLFTRHAAMRDELLEASRDAGEKFWPLPMYEEYLQLLQKGPADLCNVGGRWGGAITAALFLGEFLPRDVPWAHLDIAGPAFAETDLPEASGGATGAGVPTLVRWLEGA
jgi:leucyl aminopeptidase